MSRIQRPPSIEVWRGTQSPPDAPLERETSLLPGEVRTPSVIVSLSEAWAEMNAEWAAPGSSVWEEENAAPSQRSVQTPLTGYAAQSEVWCSAAGSPLMEENIVHTFSNAVQYELEPPPNVADLAAAALQGLQADGTAYPSGYINPSTAAAVATAGIPYGFSQEQMAVVGGQEVRAPMQSIHVDPGSVEPPAGSFTVQEGGTVSSDKKGILPPHGNSGDTNDSYHHHGNSSYGALPKLNDAAVAQSIIVSAGLPLSIQSLVDYIRDGQPHVSAHTAALGTTQNTRRNFPNLNEPPVEEGIGRGGDRGARGREEVASYSPSLLLQNQQQPLYQNGVPAWDAAATRTAGEEVGFAVRGSEEVFHSQHHHNQQPPAPMRFGGFKSGVEDHLIRHAVATRPKSESEVLSDLLHFHANFFPPPPPPRVPPSERRTRAELWYHYANKWDITHRLPPPPRIPLPEMEMEYRMRLPNMTRVPYHGDGWLDMGERWFDVMQSLFDFPEENVGEQVDWAVVLDHAVLS